MRGLVVESSATSTLDNWMHKPIALFIRDFPKHFQRVMASTMKNCITDLGSNIRYVRLGSCFVLEQKEMLQKCFHKSRSEFRCLVWGFLISVCANVQGAEPCEGELIHSPHGVLLVKLTDHKYLKIKPRVHRYPIWIHPGQGHTSKNVCRLHLAFEKR